MRREWFVAVCGTGGEYAGNPPSFEAATIYGPYTRPQAERAEAIGDDFPHETYCVVTFKADERPDFRELLKIIRAKVAQVTDTSNEDDE